MRRRVAYGVAAAVAALMAGSARADSFGGFSTDGKSVLVGADRVCTAVLPGGGAPSCRKAASGEVSRLGFRKGTLQRGAGASISAEAAGIKLRVRDAKTNAVLAEWSSPDAIARVSAIHLSADGKLVAVEYEARIGGRETSQVVAISLAVSRGTVENGQQATPASPATPVAAPRPVLTPAQEKSLAALVKASDKLLKRKRWAKAELGYRKALERDDQHAAAIFGAAATLARRGKRAEAIAELERLARSADVAAPVWLVEARSSAHFAGVRGDPAFRRAVGIDPDPSRPASAYERVVGQGGHWEQSGQPCQQPTVNLKLDRKTKKFALSIRNRCQGDDETTRLAGVWMAEGRETLNLRFPNPGGDDEILACGLAEERGEDALSCELEDIRFTMKVVRR